MRALVLAVALLAGCEACAPPPVAGPVPHRIALPIARHYPPHAMRLLWAAMEVCTGLKGDVDGWTWWAVDGDAIPSSYGPAIGLTDWDTHRIYVVRARLGEVGLLAHEILHALGVWEHVALYRQCEPAPGYW